MSDSLDFDVREPLSHAAAQCALLNVVWGTNLMPQSFLNDPTLGASYVCYYEKQCQSAFTRHKVGLKLLLQTHQDVVNIIQQIKDPTNSRETIKLTLRNQHPNLPSSDCDGLLCEAIDLAVRIWLMIDIGEMPHGFTPGQKSVLWENGSLPDLIQGAFVPQLILQESVKLGRIFNARNLERIAGISIFWTSNLSDHLRLMNDDTRVGIFHHASFLEHQKTNKFFEPSFIDETLRSLSLLLPQHDKETRKWFRSQKRKHFLDGALASCGHLTTEARQINNFVFWHDRLVILKQLFDESEPSTIAQWWCDRRRKVQWYTFWIAAVVLSLTILFGVVQCIEGGLQVYKAYYPANSNQQPGK